MIDGKVEEMFKLISFLLCKNSNYGKYVVFHFTWHGFILSDKNKHIHNFKLISYLGPFPCVPGPPPIPTGKRRRRRRVKVV